MAKQCKKWSHNLFCEKIEALVIMVMKTQCMILVLATTFWCVNDQDVRSSYREKVEQKRAKITSKLIWGDHSFLENKLSDSTSKLING